MKPVLIYTSYFHPSPEHDWFYPHQVDTLFTALSKLPVNCVRYITLCQAGSIPPRHPLSRERIVNTGNLPTLGTGMQMTLPPFYTCSISGLFLGLWLAYNDDRDFIFCEQDVLPFGNWFNQLYADVGDGDAGFSHVQMMGPEAAGLGLFLVRHSGIPEFQQRFLEQGPERGSDVVEAKVGRIIKGNLFKYKWLSFGVDRDRPFDMNAESFFVHKPTPTELRALHERGLFSDITGMPAVKAFTNNP